MIDEDFNLPCGSPKLKYAATYIKWNSEKLEREEN